jgi:hypothetical protein
MVADVVLPVTVIVPGIPVTVHESDGKPLSATDPVVTVQVGCVMVPVVGLAGVTGAVLITTFAEAAELHPEAFLTVNV